MYSEPKIDKGSLMKFCTLRLLFTLCNLSNPDYTLLKYQAFVKPQPLSICIEMSIHALEFESLIEE